MSVSPRPNDNPQLTRKIETLHQHLVQERKKMILLQKEKVELTSKLIKPLKITKRAISGGSIISDKSTSPAIKPTTTQPIAPKPVSSSNTLLPQTISKLDEMQLQMLLPIPLTPNKRWLMMDIGDDFTHIWLSQWQKFLGLDRIKEAVSRSRVSGKTISLAPANCNPEVFVTAQRPNMIFVGPYNNNEQQKLALFYETEDKKKVLSENYSKLSTSKAFSKKSIGLYTFFEENS